MSDQEHKGELAPINLEKPAACCGSPVAVLSKGEFDKRTRGKWICVCGADQKIEDYYFRLELTENEHWIVADDIRRWVSLFPGTILYMYYRKMKNGHIPMLREVKVIGTSTAIGKFKEWMVDQHLTDNVVPNEKGL